MLRETFRHTLLRNAAGSFFLNICFLIAAHPALAGSITITPLGLPIAAPAYGAVYNFATAINNNGQVAGYTYVDMPRQPFVMPFLYSGGVVTDILGPLDPLAAQANGINNKGQVVGMTFMRSSSPAGRRPIWTTSLRLLRGIP